MKNRIYTKLNSFLNESKEKTCNVIIKSDDDIDEYKMLAKKFNGNFISKQNSNDVLLSLEFNFSNNSDLLNFKKNAEELYPEDII